MIFLPFAAVWAVMVFVFTMDPILSGLVLAVMGAVYWWFIQVRGI